MSIDLADPIDDGDELGDVVDVVHQALADCAIDLDPDNAHLLATRVAELLLYCEDCASHAAPCARCGCDTKAAGEWYFVHDDVWAAATLTPNLAHLYLCIGCLEAQLGRELDADDFVTTATDDNRHNGSARLRDRLTRAADGDPHGWTYNEPEP